MKIESSLMAELAKQQRQYKKMIEGIKSYEPALSNIKSMHEIMSPAWKTFSATQNALSSLGSLPTAQKLIYPYSALGRDSEKKKYLHWGLSTSKAFQILKDNSVEYTEDVLNTIIDEHGDLLLCLPYMISTSDKDVVYKNLLKMLKEENRKYTHRLLILRTLIKLNKNIQELESVIKSIPDMSDLAILWKNDYVLENKYNKRIIRKELVASGYIK